MNSWLLSLVGIAFLGVLVDVLTPNKNLNKYIKSIFAIFFLFVIVSPMKQVLLDGANLFNISNGVVVETDDDFLVQNNLARKAVIESNINRHLLKNNIKGVNVVISINLEDFDFKILEVGVDIKNIVLTDNVTHKNKYEVITANIYDVINVNKDVIKFYE